MTPTTCEECQREIDHLRDHEPDFDELYVDAIDPSSGKVVPPCQCDVEHLNSGNLEYR